MNRRSFLTVAAAAITGGAILPGSSFSSIVDRHRELCERTFTVAADMELARRPIGEVIVGIGKLFTGAPYEAHTLEKPGAERLVINLEVFDCVTLVENTIALARCIKNGVTTFEAYTRELHMIRYRGGILDGYPSRLHYFSDWIYDNERKGYVKDVSRQIGGAEPFRKTINFMSEYRDSYTQLSNNDYFRTIKQQEKVINSREYYFIPKGNFHIYENNMQEGDILGFTTNIRGLDIQHTALAIKVDDRFHALHAPAVGSAVEITGKNLTEYMILNRRMTGLMVARPRGV